MSDELIDVGVTFLLKMLKDPKRTGKWKRTMLKVFKAIAVAYSGDQDFESVVVQHAIQP